MHPYWRAHVTYICYTVHPLQNKHDPKKDRGKMEMGNVQHIYPSMYIFFIFSIKHAQLFHVMAIKALGKVKMPQHDFSSPCN